MFIDSFCFGSSLQRSEMHGLTCSSASTLRSAGAPDIVAREVYRRLAPLEPEHHGLSFG